MSAAAGPPIGPAPKRPARTRRLDCPNCGGVVEVRANGISVSAICSSCGATIDLASPELRVIAEARARTREPDLVIGKRGRLAGTEWEVVGFQVRSNPSEGWSWDEYLLFNPYRGFRFLAHDDEGWTLFCMLRQDVPDPHRIAGDNRRYGSGETSEARTDYVLGEFYWRAKEGDLAQVTEHASGDHVLIQERTGDEIVWSRGVKIPPGTVEGAFGLAPRPPSARPAPDPRRKTVAVLCTGAAAIALLFLLNAVSFGASRSLLVFRQEYRVPASERNRPVVSAPFAVPDASGNLRIDMRALVRNDWVDLDVSLVSEPAGQSFNGSRTIEYYTGTDADGAWTEGSQEASILFRDVPGGAYRLLVDADAGLFRTSPPSPATGVNFNAITANAQRSLAGQSGAKPPALPTVSPSPPEPGVAFTIEVRRHVPAPEFFWMALLLLLPYPAYRLFWRRNAR
jgi:hypothetical protein